MLKRFFLIMSAVVFVLGTSGAAIAMMCGSGADAQAAEESSQKAVNVGNKICPVSGEKVDSMGGATFEYEGKIYNFCCPGCIKPFKQEPNKYIEKVNSELKGTPEKF